MLSYLHIILLSSFTISGIARRIVLCEPSNCHNEGTCVGDKCVCATGFRGSFCEIEQLLSLIVFRYDEINCRNGGICEKGSCTCLTGFAGNRCQRKRKCGESVPCGNGGACVDKKCVCAEGFRGNFCQIDKCDNIDCRNGGICEKGSCTCLTGFAGNRCQRKRKCGESVPCGNGGACVDKKCVCAEGFRGNFCQIDKCNNRCRNGGTCDQAQGSCICPAGYAGERCQDKLTSVVCGSSSMTVNIDKRLVIGKASGVHFRDQSCSGEYSSLFDEITLTTDYSQCGTSFEEDNTTITFTNEVTYAKPNPDDGTEITREYQLQVKVECCLNKEEDVDGTFRFQQALAP